MPKVRCFFPIQHEAGLILADHMNEISETFARQGVTLPPAPTLTVTREQSMTLHSGTQMDVVHVEYETSHPAPTH